MDENIQDSSSAKADVEAIWSENMKVYEQKLESDPKAKFIKPLEKCRVKETDKVSKAGYFCGYYSDGIKLEEHRFLILMPDNTFIVAERDKLSGLTKGKKPITLQDKSKIERIKLKLAGLLVETQQEKEIEENVVSRIKFTREDCRIDYLDLDGVNVSDSISKRLEAIISNMARVERPEIVIPIMISALLIPSAMVMNYPIIIFYGRSGTGKSGLLRLGEAMFGIPLVGTTATYAGIRNHIEEFRYVVDEETGELIEQNILIVIDDIDSNVILRDNKLLGMLKTGNSFSTGNTRISSNETGKNMTFNMACPKALSTCDDQVWLHPDLHELKRRVVIIPTAYRPELRDTLLDKEEINFNSGTMALKLAIESFWLDNVDKFKVNYRKGRGLDRELTATLATVYDIPMPEAKKKVEAYRNFIEVYMDKPLPAFTYLDKLITEEESKVNEIIEKRISEGRSDIPSFVRIKSSEIRAELKKGVDEGIFDTVTVRQIADLMKAKGYHLEQSSGSWYWLKPI